MIKNPLKSLIFFLLISFQLSAQTNIVFDSLSDMTSKRYGMGNTFDGNKIYAISGGSDIFPYISTSMEAYDLNSNTWTEIRNDLLPRRFCSAEYIASLEKIYILNGYHHDWVTDSTVVTAYTDTVEIYDVNSGEITYSSSNPYPVSYAGSAAWNNKIYIFGGSNKNGSSNRLYEFYPELDQWTRLPDMPEAKSTGGSIVNGILYVFGGYSGITSTRIDAYDIQNQTWSSLGNMPVGISSHATTISGKNIWLVGSYDNLQSLAVFNIETSEFTQLATNMTGRRHAGAIILGDSLYVFGGNQSSNSLSSLNSTEYADISGYIVSISDKNHIQPTDFHLSQNYPNPFNPTTIISYSIPKQANINLTIYNVLGKEVKTLVDEIKPSGNYKIKFDATELPSGVYFYRLGSGDFSETKKLILLR